MSYTPGEGSTVSMLNGTSTLKMFANVSAIGIFSTDRPFSPGLPLLLLPASPFGLNTNTFDFHSRQSNIGAIFTGPEFCGLTPSATFLAFIANDSLVADNYGLLPYNAFGELKNEDWRLAAGLQNDVFNPRKPTIISLASLFGSGNTGSFRGQARLERFLKPAESLAITLQGALSESIQSVFTDRNTRIVEDNGLTIALSAKKSKEICSTVCILKGSLPGSQQVTCLQSLRLPWRLLYCISMNNPG